MTYADHPLPPFDSTSLFPRNLFGMCDDEELALKKAVEEKAEADTTAADTRVTNNV